MIESVLLGLKFTGYSMLVTSVLTFILGYLFRGRKEEQEEVQE